MENLEKLGKNKIKFRLFKLTKINNDYAVLR